MGQVSSCSGQQHDQQQRTLKLKSFPDLVTLPPELAVQVLSHLDATDLCLASCVNEGWCSLANVELLWKRLCENRWRKVTAYHTDFSSRHSYKQLYMILDNGTLTFSADPNEGISYLVSCEVLGDDPHEIAEFIHHTNSLDWQSLGRFLQARRDVLDCLVQLHSFASMFLPDALRAFFSSIPAPNERGRFLESLLDRFSSQYVQCNISTNTMSKDTVFVVCYSLIMLSVDLTSPHVKNKMSKREFIRNLRRATPRQEVTDDVLGHMYDNIYLSGHVATDY